MPRRVRTTKRRGRPATRAVVRRKPMRGRGFWSKLKKFGLSANRWLKKSKAISTAGKIGSILGVPYVGTVGKIAALKGYGRKRTVRCRRHRTGAGIMLPGRGGALRLAGRRRTGGAYSKKKTTRGIQY